MAFKTEWLEKYWWNETGSCPASLKSALGRHAERGINWQGVWLWNVGLGPNPGETGPVFSGQFQWRRRIQQLRRTRKMFSLQQPKDVLTVQDVSVGWGGHSLPSYLLLFCRQADTTTPHCGALSSVPHKGFTLTNVGIISQIRKQSQVWLWIIIFPKPTCNHCSWNSPGCLAVIKKRRHRQPAANRQ